MSRIVMFALTAMVCFGAPAWAQSESPYASMSLDDMIEDATVKVGEMTDAVARVSELRGEAESDADASAYQRLNNFYTQMNGRLLVAEEALENLRDARGTRGRRKAPGTSKQGADRSYIEHNYGIVVAAHTSVMSDLQRAQSVISGGVTAGEGTSVTADGVAVLPTDDVTFRGTAVTPTRSADPVVDNSDFQGRTPSNAGLGN